MSGQRSGVGLTTILGVVFIVLKLTGVIAWSWLWVLAPFWIGLALWLVGVVIFLIALGVSLVVSRRT